MGVVEGRWAVGGLPHCLTCGDTAPTVQAGGRPESGRRESTACRKSGGGQRAPERTNGFVVYLPLAPPGSAGAPMPFGGLHMLTVSQAQFSRPPDLRQSYLLSSETELGGSEEAALQDSGQVLWIPLILRPHLRGDRREAALFEVVKTSFIQSAFVGA